MIQSIGRVDIKSGIVVRTFVNIFLAKYGKRTCLTPMINRVHLIQIETAATSHPRSRDGRIEDDRSAAVR
jgi:hypothetical protein